MRKTAAANRSGGRRFKSGEVPGEWLNPDRRILQWAQEIRQNGAETALDLGCGVGRHSLALARLGFVTTAFDSNLSSLEYARNSAEEDGLALIFERGNIMELPFPAASFDYVLSVNVIYHGDADLVRQALSEVRRVLKPDGKFHCTMLSKRNHRFGEGREVEPNTYVIGEHTGDKDEPHYYCNAAELVEIFAGFEIRSLVDHEQKGAGTWHWYVVAEPT